MPNLNNANIELPKKETKTSKSISSSKHLKRNYTKGNQKSKRKEKFGQ